MDLARLFPGHAHYADSSDNVNSPVGDWDNGWWLKSTRADAPYYIITLRGRDGFFVVTKWEAGEMLGPFDAATALATATLLCSEVTG